MKVVKVNWFEHKPTDNNNGLVYGLEELNKEFGCIGYVEWFKTEKAREKAIKNNNFEVQE